MDTQKNAVVTGGSRGIGRGIVSVLAEAGWNVFFSYNSCLEEAESLKLQLEKDFPVKVRFIQASLEKKGEAERLMQEAELSMGDISLAVNNAGRTIFESILEMTEEGMDTLIDLDLKGYLRMCRAAANHMKERGIHGSIVNITSTRGERAYPGDAVYGGVKAAVERATRSMALDLAPYGIRVNCVAPGATRVRESSAPFYEYLGERIPLGRVGTPEDIGQAVRFLGSEESSYVTGALIKVDGGLTLPGMPESRAKAEADRGWGWTGKL